MFFALLSPRSDQKRYAFRSISALLWKFLYAAAEETIPSHDQLLRLPKSVHTELMLFSPLSRMQKDAAAHTMT